MRDSMQQAATEISGGATAELNKTADELNKAVEGVKRKRQAGEDKPGRAAEASSQAGA